MISIASHLGAFVCYTKNEKLISSLWLLCTAIIAISMYIFTIRFNRHKGVIDYFMNLVRKPLSILSLCLVNHAEKTIRELGSDFDSLFKDDCFEELLWYFVSYQNEFI